MLVQEKGVPAQVQSIEVCCYVGSYTVSSVSDLQVNRVARE